jgi:glycine/D-amino acid oxidase-like deaminating enzyme
VFGASIADRLAGEGFEVTLVEREAPGHPGAESGGESRLIRFSHGADELYTRSAWRSRELWLELGEEVGEELLVPCGVAWFARRPDGWEAESERVLRAEGIPVERLTPRSGRKLFPSLHAGDLPFVLHEPEAGVLRAAAATRALAERAVRRGARLERGEARPAGDVVELDGRRLEADLVVWACGAWLASLFPGLVELRVTLQDVLFFEAPAGWSTPPLPAYADYDGAAYGLGLLDGHGVKVALDIDGPPVDPDSRPAEAAPESERAAAGYLARRFPALAGAAVERTKVCHYSTTADGGFVLDRHPEHERVWIAGGGSGHGFKHGPAFAEQAVAVMTGRAEPEPRFALGPRVPGRSLRTAGWVGADG